ncbi:hypothetical protein PB1_15574 [Bacillus methanolicus PB1]|uniref:Uncharacterized protein n=1 Tax=Bacillus methanolicus PB1 TaxID=997296 RepID=I3DXM0_BACMT|nr:hypothetical protein PB1_15574 [Bacillus methanolicus PB1]
MLPIFMNLKLCSALFCEKIVGCDHEREAKDGMLKKIDS